MAESTKANFSNIDEYIALQSEKTQPLLREIRTVIRASAPEATEKIAYQLPTFWQGENLIHFGAFKNHIGLFPGGAATTEFAERLKDYKVSKGTIHLPLEKPIDHQLITDIVHWRLKEAAAKTGKGYGRN